MMNPSTAITVALTLLAAETSAEFIKMGEHYTNEGKGKKALPLLEKALADETLGEADRGRGELSQGLSLLQV
ncbi:MAG: hypothetical protein ACO3JL_06895, partial [Myxococcota bacterium]